jgi:hypothetical protein
VKKLPMPFSRRRFGEFLGCTLGDEPTGSAIRQTITRRLRFTENYGKISTRFFLYSNFGAIFRDGRDLTSQGQISQGETTFSPKQGKACRWRTEVPVFVLAAGDVELCRSRKRVVSLVEASGIGERFGSHGRRVRSKGKRKASRGHVGPANVSAGDGYWLSSSGLMHRYEEAAQTAREVLTLMPDSEICLKRLIEYEILHGNQRRAEHYRHRLDSLSAAIQGHRDDRSELELVLGCLLSSLRPCRGSVP